MQTNNKHLIVSGLLLVLILLFITSCGGHPDPIDYGKDECEFCRMQITDNKYGAEIVTGKGKTYKFDSMECMLGFALLKNLVGDRDNRLLISNFNNPGELLDARHSFYIKNDNFRSPMGLNVTAFGSKDAMNKFLSKNDGESLTWLDVIELAKQRSM